MKVRLNVLLNASDDFKCGDCNKCPIHQESYFSTHQYEELKIYCPLGYNSISCPIEILAEVEPYDIEMSDTNDVLDKIRAEIMKLDDINPDYPMDRTIHISRNEVLQIIDKYKAESEECRRDILPKYEAKVITRGNCMICGKELDEGLFFCKECEAKAESEG